MRPAPVHRDEQEASAYFSGHKTEPAPCFHCGSACRGEAQKKHDKQFCCNGCLTVFELLTENGLTEFYQLSEAAGVRVRAETKADQFRYLDEPAVLEKLADYQDGRTVRITFRVPAIHCIACVWLLENLFRIKPGIGRSQVDFARKKLSLSFDPRQIGLSQVAALLASMGYEPELKFSDLDGPRGNPALKRLWMQIGVAGFAFGNNMLFSIALYFGVDAFSGPMFQKMAGYMSMALATPVLLYSARDYFRLAWTGLKHRLLTIEVPIAAGILVIYAQSAFEVISGRGEGYFDSFAGLLFFLLCGRLFQQKTYERLAFDRDFKSFFPLSVQRVKDGAEESVSLGKLETGDRLRVRNGELIPADAHLIAGAALIDYSFVTGESEPASKSPGEYLYAGGRQIGAAIEIETVKAVSQSYLTSLWNQDAFKKEAGESLDTLINRYSQRFTKIVILVALAAAGYWAIYDPGRSLKAFTSVLIVACPCALALAAPFTLGTAIRVLGRRNIFVKSAHVIERLARIDSIVFDKTGTLTAAGAGSIRFDGRDLTREEEVWVYSMTRHSTHPLAVRIGEAIARDHFPAAVRSFAETAGCGMEGSVEGREIWIGSAAWLESRGARVPAVEAGRGSVVHLAIDGMHRGAFVLASSLRRHSSELLGDLARRHELALLSGDGDRDRARLQTVFGEAELHFEQSPLDKLKHIERRQRRGRSVMMVGDGLNDAGALKQSDVGVAVVENVGAFSPASDIIMSAGMLPKLGSLLDFSRASVRIVKFSFVISSLYNLVGVGIAASGRLAPIVCAILMPLSSISVVAFACLATAFSGRQQGLGAPAPGDRP